MAFDRLKDEIDAMIGSLDDKPPHDKQELHQEIFEKLQRLKAFGMPLPQDLVDLEAALSEELQAEDAGPAAETPDDPA